MAVALLLLAVACTNVSSSTSTGSTTTVDDRPPGTTSPGSPVSGFDDHTVPRLSTVDEYSALARSGVSGQSVVKFTIPSMLSGSEVHWLDSNFYELHDEWYWFRLLNGQPVPGSDAEPLRGESFSTIEEVYAWAGDQRDLPLGLRWVDSSSFGERLYSDAFYELVLDTTPRTHAVGSLVRMAAPSGEEHWLIELEYGDEPTPEQIAVIFERLTATVPDEIGSRLEWVLRSPQQEAIAEEMAETSLPYHDRVVRYADLVTPGQVAVYNEGIAAGRLLYVGPGSSASLTDAKPTDILVVENVPDWLPPATALISAAPQTPLAHVNLLARNRGIPNASQAGVLDDAGIRQAARVRAPAIVRASGSDVLEVVLITENQYSQWRSLLDTETISVPDVDVSSMPLVVDLTTVASGIRSEADVEAWRPIIGGKSAGFFALLSADGVRTPVTPVAITVRPYLEHLSNCLLYTSPSPRDED